MNCIIIDDDIVAREMLKLYISKMPALNIIQEFETPINAISFIKENQVDLIFLDVRMPEMSGMEFISQLDEEHPEIILTTSHEEFALDAFQFNVSGYIVKPLKFQNFSIAVKKVLKGHKSNKTLNFRDQVIFIKDGQFIVKLDKAEVKLIECIGDYVSLFTEKKKYVVHSSMKAINERFAEEQYIRVHRSFIIRLDAIEDVQDDTISFGSRLIPIGKTYKSSVYKRLNII